MNDSPPKNPADYVSASVARNFCSFSASALRVWADAGRRKNPPTSKRTTAQHAAILFVIRLPCESLDLDKFISVFSLLEDKKHR